MKKLYPITTKVLNAIETVVDYLYEDEEKHWEESNKERGHIFTYIKTLEQYLNNLNKTIKIKSRQKPKSKH